MMRAQPIKQHTFNIWHLLLYMLQQKLNKWNKIKVMIINVYAQFESEKENVHALPNTPFTPGGSFYVPESDYTATSTEISFDDHSSAQSDQSKPADALNAYLHSRDVSPIRSTLSTPWDTVAHNCHHNYKLFTAKPNSSRQNQKRSRQNKIAHGKTKKLAAKLKKFTGEPKSSRQNKKAHGKTK